MSNFVSIDEDKFEKKMTYLNSKQLNLFTHGGASICGCKMSFRRIVVMPDQDCLVMDLDIVAYGSDWPNLNRGKIILLIDGEPVTLNNPGENYHDCDVHDGETYYKESCYFEIDDDLLKRICDSKSFAMQIYVATGRSEVKNVNAVVVYSKLFYNAVYDSTAYTDVVANALGEFTRANAEMSSFSEIALDGSGANGGCMGMLALLITMAGTAIGGICALV